ncbi:MAG TPA: prepilin-type N-terminal cleavage/methylation domain-containing protein [Patescibacteria group bacterium]|nr:prepilin-type N-terminal cleavage/methylation domain-containing protein [Patescibacteria group bacterium]
MKRKTHLKLKHRGFTLVEVLLAVFVLEIGLLGVAGFYAYSLNIAKFARNETTAANLAQGLLDEQLSSSFDNLSVGEGGKTAYSSDPSSPFANFKKQVDIAWLAADLTASYTQIPGPGGNENMKKITVTIFWPFESGEKSFQMATIKAKH